MTDHDRAQPEDDERPGDLFSQVTGPFVVLVAGAGFEPA
jgi:hypothetical protein